MNKSPETFSQTHELEPDVLALAPVVEKLRATAPIVKRDDFFEFGRLHEMTAPHVGRLWNIATTHHRYPGGEEKFRKDFDNADTEIEIKAITFNIGDTRKHMQEIETGDQHLDYNLGEQGWNLLTRLNNEVIDDEQDLLLPWTSHHQILSDNHVMSTSPAVAQARASIASLNKDIQA